MTDRRRSAAPRASTVALGFSLSVAFALAAPPRAATRLVAASPAPEPAPLRLVVMDPVSKQLACACVAGYAQRDWDRLGAFLAGKLGREVEVRYAESLSAPAVGAPEKIDLIAGKLSEVRADGGRRKLRLRPIAMLSDRNGLLTQRGLFVVRGTDPTKSLAKLRGRTILFGPPDADEKHSAALATLEALGVPVASPPRTSPACDAAALAVVERKADAAVVSDYAMPLLEGCGTIDRGALRIVERTDPVPFIALLATARVGAATEKALRAALAAAARDAKLLEQLESAGGFVPLLDEGEWTDWRGAGRRALSPWLPDRLPPEPRLLWSRTLTGRAMSGLALASGRLIVADKDADEKRDIFRSLDAWSGRELWKVSWPAAGEMDFTNSPRANPVARDGLLWLLGAFGELRCVRLESGETLWRRNIVADFAAKPPAWGACSTPLLVGEKLIVNPGARGASLVALEAATGKLLWKAPGVEAGYGSLILAELGGVRQIVGHDAVSLGGWDPETGRRLWRLLPPEEGDFNVPTPLALGGRLLVSTENNGARLYGFDPRGNILPEPLARSEALVPDTSTPVALGSLLVGSSGRLVALDLERSLATSWTAEEEGHSDYASLIAGRGRILVVEQSGRLELLEATRAAYRPLSRLDLFRDVPATERDVWSHPALAAGRLYVRNLLGVYCFLLDLPATREAPKRAPAEPAAPPRVRL